MPNKTLYLIVSLDLNKTPSTEAKGKKRAFIHSLYNSPAIKVSQMSKNPSKGTEQTIRKSQKISNLEGSNVFYNPHLCTRYS